MPTSTSRALHPGVVLVHVAVWAVLGLMALGYLGTSLLSDEPLLAAKTETPARPDTVSLELARVRTRIAGLEDQGQVLADRLAAIEEKAATTASAPQPSLTVVSVPAPAPPAATPPAAEPPRLQLEPARPVSAEITTGAILGQAGRSTVAPPPAAAVPGVAPVALTPPSVRAQQAKTQAFGVQLTSAPNIDGLRLSWTLLGERHRDVLGALQARYRPQSARAGAPLQLLAGPFASEADAAQTCRLLNDKGVPCTPAAYTGTAL